MRKQKAIPLLVGSLCLLLLGGIVVAVAMSSDNYSIGWSVLSTGGGPTGSDNYSARSSITQTGIGRSSSDNYESGSGYWYRGVRPTPGIPKPDLVIEEIWTKERRDRCKVYFVVKNIGTATTPRGHYATLFVNDQPVEEKRVRRDLGTGEQYESSFRIRVSCTADIRVCADNTHVVNESDETNNCWPPIVEKPDLVIEDKREEWVNETHYNVTYVVHNSGTVKAPGGHRTTLIVDGVAIEHKEVPVDLEYCQTYEDTFDTVIECTGDSDFIRVCADNDGIIDEINEDNNCLQNEWSCEVVEKPDLIITNIETKERRGKCKVYFVVENIGTATAPRSHHATLLVNDQAVEEKHVRKALRPGRSYKGYFRTTVSCTDVIKVCADNFKVVDELDETNNCLEYGKP